MPDLVDSVMNILSGSQARAEIAGQNVASATLPGYKRRVAFAEFPAMREGAGQPSAQIAAATDFSPGKLVQTGNPFDLAISGAGFFAVRQGDAVHYVRAARLTLDSEGRPVDTFGAALQTADGRDLVVKGASFKVARSGEVNIDGRAAGRIAVFATDTAELSAVPGGFAPFAAGMIPAETTEVVQGAYEASNVSMGDEMVALMAALRQAEAGQRVMIAYDDIMGRVLSTFAESAR